MPWIKKNVSKLKPKGREPAIERISEIKTMVLSKGFNHSGMRAGEHVAKKSCHP